jgi:hypothetical protein
MDIVLSNGTNGNNTKQGLMSSIESRREKRRVGAASRCTPTTVDIILDSLESGTTEAEACKNAGISVQTLWAWKQVIPGFVESVALAHKQQIACRIDNVQRKMEEIDVDTLDPKLAMAHLRKIDQLFRANMEVAKRRDPATWGDRQLNVTISTELDPVDLSKYLKM